RQAGWVSSGILHSLSCAQQDGTYACISVKGSCETCVLRLLKTPKTCLRFEGRADALRFSTIIRVREAVRRGLSGNAALASILISGAGRRPFRAAPCRSG